MTCLSFLGSSGWSCATYSPRLPSPLVSRTNGVQPWARLSSPVFSNVFRSNHPRTPGPTTPGLVHSTLFLSKCRWCVGKQVRMSVQALVFGSKYERCRLAPPLSGKAFADGCAEPALHQSGLASGLMREVNQVRPRSSIIGLWLSVRPSQYGCSPQYADTPYGLPFT